MLFNSDARIREMIKTNHMEINWFHISEYEKLSEDFIREFQEDVHWFCICRKQILSENFIREFQNKVEWNELSRFQPLSKDFIKEFIDKIDWCWLPLSFNISSETFFLFSHYYDLNWVCNQNKKEIVIKLREQYPKKRILTYDEILPYLVIYELCK